MITNSPYFHINTFAYSVRALCYDFANCHIIHNCIIYMSVISRPRFELDHIDILIYVFKFSRYIYLYTQLLNAQVPSVSIIRF